MDPRKKIRPGHSHLQKQKTLLWLEKWPGITVKKENGRMILYDFIGFGFIYMKNRKLQDNILNSMCFDQKALFANINAQTAFVRYLISDLKEDLCSIQVHLY